MYRTVHFSNHTNCSLSVECLLDARLWRRFFMKYTARDTTAFEFLKVDAATYSRVQYCIVCTQAVLDSTLNALESRGNAIKSECCTVLLSSTSLRGGDGPKRRCAAPPPPRRAAHPRAALSDAKSSKEQTRDCLIQDTRSGTEQSKS